ncbi:hypothetical protein ACSAGD_00630 [Paramicrobacterium sp. CJ85]|uniref:hypothetical protein n=1 Tax=Paramicrobacterium sp. CJ85 TaxID=3445355 RepID=UPI003F6338C4
MSDPGFEPNFSDTDAPTPGEVEANEADVLEQRLSDLSQTPEDVDEGGASAGYGDEAETELEDANDYEEDSDYEGPDDYDED